MNDQADAQKARARARIGQVLREKWRLDALLGVGGMAAVYAATHVNNGRRAAIKLLHSELSASPDVRTRFLREGYVANKVEHPGAVGVLDDQVSEDGSVFLVMELLDGETLEDRRERAGSLPAHEVLSVADRLLDVLSAAHDKGIVHRDIKPENVFLTRDGSVKVLDFGIARMREVEAARLTLTGAGALGTPAFMPPEQARGRWDEVGPRSNLWAVGATMFTLVAGRLVHQAETVNELMLAAMTRQAPPIGSIVPNLPPSVAAVIDRALAYDPGARWADARAMQSALRMAYQSFNRVSLLSVTGGASQPYAAPVPMAPAAPSPLAPGVTAHPVTLVGGAGAPPSSRRFPVLAMVGGLVGALVTGGALLLVATRRPSIDRSPAASSSVVTAAPAPAASDSPRKALVTEVDPPASSAGGVTSSVSAAAVASAPPAVVEAPASAKPRATLPSRPRPGSAWPRPKR